MSDIHSTQRPTILVVDDEPLNLQVLRQLLHADYRLVFAKDGRSALSLATSSAPDLVLLDVMMPGMTGYEVCRALKDDARTRHVPVIFVTALADDADEALGLEAGAVDYITKPVSAPILKARVRTHLSLVRAEELHLTRMQAIRCLGIAAEFKDNETGAHVVRMSHYAQVLALASGYGAAQADDMLHAAPMHDIGTIGIPDAILQKPGKLTDAEREVMKAHPLIGAQILGEHASPLFRMARTIALPPREMGRHRLPERTGRRRHSACRAHRRAGRRVRRADQRAAVQARLVGGRGDGFHPEPERHALRPRAGRPAGAVDAADPGDQGALRRGRGRTAGGRAHARNRRARGRPFAYLNTERRRIRRMRAASDHEVFVPSETARP